ncbi:serine hydrolase domain-containing protein [Actinoplanes sp. RD1]|uniref:serine hydrolase domain-containing protein n=1 Tax=Actinoplanes sp. RD1 TaxID=3064538 RepID=UPI002741E524|nr:serine hydrolase domain-containing protein [Actinoplanes sp. RD1]
MKTVLSMVVATTMAASPGTTADTPQSRLDAITAAGTIGVLAEVRGPDGTWRGTAGVARRGTSEPVPAGGRFRAGSITKTFVATVVLQLVDEGRLRLDDPVDRWLPGVVPDGRRITVRHLLNHSSGLADYADTLPMPPAPEFFAGRWRTWTAAELIRRAVANPPASTPPGSAYAYSNTGYLVLGEIVEAVTGRPYGKEIERRILRPLHLRDTTVPGTAPGIPGPHPHGYVPGPDGDLVDYTEMNPSMFGAAGEMISTTRDLDEFSGALAGGRLLPPPLLAAMKTPAVAGGSYGLGLERRDTPCGIRAYGNDGGTLTYQAWTFSTEDGGRQVTVAVTPDLRRDPVAVFAAVNAFLDAALCG